MNDQARPMVIGVLAGSAVTALVALLINGTPVATAAAASAAKPVRMGVEIDCSGVPHETVRGEMLVITGHTSMDPQIATMRKGDFRRDVDMKGKICSVDAVPLKDG